MIAWLKDYWNSIVWGAPEWRWAALAFVLITLAVLIWSYLKVQLPAAWRLLALGLKLAGIVALALCLLEPLRSRMQPRRGANLFLLLADNSQSLNVRDRGSGQTRAELLQKLLQSDSDWQTRLATDFDVRNYRFDARIRAVGDFSRLDMTGGSTSMATSLAALSDRFADRPVAGILLFTDGNATDFFGEAVDWERMPPVYPVMIGRSGPARDVSVQLTNVRQSNFEAAPVTVRAEVVAHGYRGVPLIAELLDEENRPIDRLEAEGIADGKALEFRFQVRPDEPGLRFYRLRVGAKSERKQFEKGRNSREATLVNNERTIVVDRGGGPYRVLYVSGRPNWEFKFLKRAVEADDEVSLVGLIRIAKREAKFDFRGRAGERTNPLFRGFDNQKDEEAEQYDQPVLLRLGTEDEAELRDGFPKGQDELYRYHAIVLDDLESQMFTQDQMTLIRRFVFERGGGFLMLGGQESFAKGRYAKSPLNDLLPVYMDPLPPADPMSDYRMALTREGLLKPWVRVRSTEEEEFGRLKAMPPFRTLNRVQSHKPGSTVLAYVEDRQGNSYPALVENQNAGRGRSAALLIGDLWRWALRRQEGEQEDLAKAWRQIARWLVADVPHRVEIETDRDQDDPNQQVEIRVLARDKSYEPLDNASVELVVVGPDNKEIKLSAESSSTNVGTYVAKMTPRQSGPYRLKAKLTAADGSEVGTREAGWVSEPAADEFRSLEINRDLLETIANKTDGEVIETGDLEAFVRGLPNRKIPIAVKQFQSMWDHLAMFAFAICCLCAEWGIRRWKGLP